MTNDEAVGCFMPGWDFISAHAEMIEVGWNTILAQLELLKIAGFGATGHTAHPQMADNVRDYGVTTAQAVESLSSRQP